MRSKSGDPRRGAILILVLLLVALISSLLATAQHIAVANARSAKAFADSLRAEELGRVAVDLLAGQILGGGPTERRNGSFSAFVDNAEIQVDYLSESARIDVNLAPPTLIAALGQASGLEPNEASALAERIAHARQGDQRQGDQRQGDHVKPFNDVEDAASAWDLDPDIFASLRPFLTVTNGSAKIDPLIADPKVVAALFEGEGPASEIFLARRAEGFETEGDAQAALPAKAREAVSFTPAPACRASARVRLQNGFRRRFEFILVTPKPRDDKVDVIAWRMVP
ncbi:type II secretion system protein GspK [Beijerinckia indica]|uniref:General secretion pathway protein K n=1 Tax=Beijerinckia indica subsp. indica (strain ATCC 9039 / DSM 1715 / NCIMB 8712) TaxID=395963 RepID=B2IBE1_BEII9|nr:type II secretion system protein GspK [Beijerinckia indica]ACB95221.1 conserved hypothetical protein [Beijerinckia indica subsp. indica ATCC 9039]